MTPLRNAARLQLRLPLQVSIPARRLIHGKTGSTVPKTDANTGSATKTKHLDTNAHNTGTKGDGDMPHPKEYVDGLEPVKNNGGGQGGKGEASPTKQPTRSTGIKQGEWYPQRENLEV